MLSFNKLNKIKKVSMFHTSTTQNNIFNWIIDAKVTQVMEEQAKTKDELTKIKEDYHQLLNNVKEQNEYIIAQYNFIINMIKNNKE